MKRKSVNIILIVLALLIVCFLLVKSGMSVRRMNEPENDEPEFVSEYNVAIPDDFKAGAVFKKDSNDPVTKKRIESLKRAAGDLSISENGIVILENVNEDSSCYDKIKDLCDDGCKLIISDAKGHEIYINTLKDEYEDVVFEVFEGDMAHLDTSGRIKNMACRDYEGRFLTGYACGLKLKELSENGKIPESSLNENGMVKAGYAGTFNYDKKCISDLTSFYLGIKRAYPNCVLEVLYAGSYEDDEAFVKAAHELIEDNCLIISDSCPDGAVCKSISEINASGREIYYAGFNDLSLISEKGCLLMCENDLYDDYMYVLSTFAKKDKIEGDRVSGLDKDAIVFSKEGESCAPGTLDAVNEMAEKIVSGEENVFQTMNFSLNGKQLGEYRIDLDGDGDIISDEDHSAVYNGVFHEQSLKSFPYFDILIDGVTELN